MNTLTVRGPLLALTAAALVACGDRSGSRPAPSAAPPQPAVAQKSTVAPGDGLPPAQCPAKADAALTGPDIVGLKLGMRAADALDFVRCRDKQAVLRFERRWIQDLQSFGIPLGEQMFEARSGDSSPCDFRDFGSSRECGPGNRVWKHVAESITVATPGAPGKERVMGVWRTQRFKSGAMPPADSLREALIAKYGPPQQQITTDPGRLQLTWLADAAGKPLHPADPRFGECARISGRSEDPQSWSEGCGMTIAASIGLVRDNPSLASEVAVGLLHQQELFSFGHTLQNELAALDQVRRQKELDSAKAKGGDVKL